MKSMDGNIKIRKDLYNSLKTAIYFKVNIYIRNIINIARIV